jgi:7-cyano-7-deazaguanine synthase
MSRKPAVVLLSGGLDSATVLALAGAEGFALHALSFRYGQRHEAELDAARGIAVRAGVTRHVILDIGLGTFGGSALTDDIPVPKGRRAADIATGIPVTYVPARNTVFLAHALAWAEVLGAFDIYIGVNALDYSGYPDCRPDLIRAFETLANLATKAGVEGAGRFTVHTPLIDLGKAQIIETGLAMGVDFAQTLSCYDPMVDDAGGVRHCGGCDACRLRLKGFRDAGIEDPAPYVDGGRR